MASVIAKNEKARRTPPRRAFSLLELTLVVLVIGLLSAAAAVRFGHDALNTTDTEGFVRRLALDMRLARRAAIATGDNHYVWFRRTAGAVTGYDLMRSASGGDAPVQPATPVPDGTTVTTPADIWDFDFGGEITLVGATSTIQINGANFNWTVSVYHATGAVRAAKTP